MVMTYHLLIDSLPLGTYAVFGFYTISGYLMTLVMQESYGYTTRGRNSFALNRFLRLYPQYWAAALLSILLVITLGGDLLANYHRSIYLPSTPEELLQNLFMAFAAWNPSSLNPRLVPPTWAVSVEIFFYLLICLGISKTLTRVKIWLLFSLCYVAFSYATGWPWSDRYFPVAAASLPFAMGAMVYFLSKNKTAIEKFKALSISAKNLFLIMLLNCLAWTILSREDIGAFIDVGFYLNVALCSLLVYKLAIGETIISLNKKTDKIIGDYSYPIYLLHWQSGLIASYIIFGEALHELSYRGLISFVAALFIVIALSSILIRHLDTPIQRIRNEIKPKGQAEAPHNV